MTASKARCRAVTSAVPPGIQISSPGVGAARTQASADRAASRLGAICQFKAGYRSQETDRSHHHGAHAQCEPTTLLWRSGHVSTLALSPARRCWRRGNSLSAALISSLRVLASEPRGPPATGVRRAASPPHRWSLGDPRKALTEGTRRPGQARKKRLFFDQNTCLSFPSFGVQALAHNLNHLLRAFGSISPGHHQAVDD